MRLPSMVVVLCVALAALRPESAAAQARFDRMRMDSLFDVLEANGRMMGAVTVREGGRVIYQRALGFRDSTAGGPVASDGETMFRIGSVTKPFTAVMIYQLVDEGRLSLDTPLSRFFPRVANADSITIRHLLGHTSGVADFSAGMDPLKPLGRAELLARIAALPSRFAPGTRWRYSNSNYALLGFIVEEVTGSTYAEQLQRRIAGRIGLRRTRFGGAVDAAANEAHSYYFDEGRWQRQPEDALENAAGAGGIVSTTADLTRFVSALFRGELVGEAGVREMTTGMLDGGIPHGKGMSPFTVRSVDRTGYAHDGSVGAFTALVGYVPRDSLAVALTINGHNYPQNRIFRMVWDVLYGTGAPLPSFTPIRLPAEATVPLEGVYAADEYGLTMTVRRTAAGLTAQTTGQDPFPLTPIGPAAFMYAHAGILIEFAEPVGGASPRFTLFQQRAAVVLTRKP